MGAGTGRSSIMVLAARPRTTLVALDLFGRSFEQHFGPSPDPRQKLLANLEAAGVAQRVTIETGDVRKLPFRARGFRRDRQRLYPRSSGSPRIEPIAGRSGSCLKPGGDFLLMLMANEAWGKLIFGPLLAHGGLQNDAWWTVHLQNAGFQVLESGHRPLTLYLLGRRLPTGSLIQKLSERSASDRLPQFPRERPIHNPGKLISEYDRASPTSSPPGGVALRRATGCYCLSDHREYRG